MIFYVNYKWNGNIDFNDYKTHTHLWWNHKFPFSIVLNDLKNCMK